jgi:hypothetical protein
MELSELTSDEALVLVGFMRIIVRADGEYSDAERQHVAIVEQALGPARFQQAMLDVRGQADKLDELKAAAKNVTRPEARRAIYDVLQKIAASDDISAEEEKPLRWLASWWALA